MGRYACGKGKETNINKANKICLMRRCPFLLVRFKNRKSRKVIPITMIEQGAC